MPDRLFSRLPRNPPSTPRCHICSLYLAICQQKTRQRFMHYSYNHNRLKVSIASPKRPATDRLVRHPTARRPDASTPLHNQSTSMANRLLCEVTPEQRDSAPQRHIQNGNMTLHNESRRRPEIDQSHHTDANPASRSMFSTDKNDPFHP